MTELDRYRVIRDVLDGKLLQRQAAQQLKLSRRQIIRICQRVRDKGARGTVHGLRGKASNHHLDHGLLERAIKLVTAHYRDFGPS